MNQKSLWHGDCKMIELWKLRRNAVGAQIVKTKSVNDKTANKIVTKSGTDMKTKTSPKTTAPVLHVDENVSFEAQIAQRAHELWHRRSCQHGSDLDDWLQAEREINEWHQKRLKTRIV